MGYLRGVLFPGSLYIWTGYDILKRVVETGKERLGPEVEDKKRKSKRSKGRFYLLGNKSFSCCLPSLAVPHRFLKS